jgi:hypothetical protein
LKIEVFYIDGCPNHQPTVDRVNELLEDLGLTAEVMNIRVIDSETALATRFLGSPTVHVNGVDVERSAHSSNHFGLMCRTYLDGSRLEGIPPTELIRQALLEGTIR